MRASLGALLLAPMLAGAQSQLLHLPLKSQRAEVSQTIGITDITIVYHRPLVGGRVIWDSLVPYGKVWRTGANEATTLVTPVDLIIGGNTVPAGSYTIFTMPNKDKWTLIISKKTGEWGTDYPGQTNDLARVDMKVSALPSPVENFTISFEKAGNGANLNIDWDTTRATVAVAKK